MKFRGRPRLWRYAVSAAAAALSRPPFDFAYRDSMALDGAGGAFRGLAERVEGHQAPHDARSWREGAGANMAGFSR